MAKIVRTIGSDFLGIWRVCGFGVAAKWLLRVGTQWRACFKQRNLQPADTAMGAGPFYARWGPSRARLLGDHVMSGIREMWVRGDYLAGDFVRIGPDAVVVDLGANMGNFTLLALGHGPGVRVVAVEPSVVQREKLNRSLAENKWTERARICPCFIGGLTQLHDEVRLRDDYSAAQFISEEQFIREFGLDRVDFLKCDIEGSEYDLLKPGSQLLANTRQLAIELHGPPDKRERFIQMLRDQGFEVNPRKADAITCTVQARRSSGTI